MNLDLKCLSLADLRLKIFTEAEADLQAQFMELLQLRERLRQAELSADLQTETQPRKPAPAVIAAIA